MHCPTDTLPYRHCLKCMSMKSKKAQIAPMCIVQLTHCVKLSVTRKAVVAQFCRHFLKIQTWCKLIKKSKPNTKKDQDHAIWKAVVVNCVVSITLSLLLRVVMIVWHSVLNSIKAQISASWKRVIAKLCCCGFFSVCATHVIGTNWIKCLCRTQGMGLPKSDIMMFSAWPDCRVHLIVSTFAMRCLHFCRFSGSG